MAKNTDTTLDLFAGSGTTGHAVINLNWEDGGRRKYVLVEMGGYFDSVLKPRIQKVVYSKDWKDGKPVSREGVSHIFKYVRLESYEDTLNNLSLRRTGVRDDLIRTNPVLRENYTISYMMDFETKGSPSMPDLDAFEDPFSYTLDVTRENETRAETVDLVETLNYLLGLTARRRYTVDGFRVVEGTDPADDEVLGIGATRGRNQTTTSTPSSRPGASPDAPSTASTPTGTTRWRSRPGRADLRFTSSRRSSGVSCSRLEACRICHATIDMSFDA